MFAGRVATLLISILLLTGAVNPTTGWFIALTLFSALSLLASFRFGRRPFMGRGPLRRRMYRLSQF
jgi:hypothetical protein